MVKKEFEQKNWPSAPHEMASVFRVAVCYESTITWTKLYLYLFIFL